MLKTKVVEKIKAHILYSMILLNRAVYEIKWKNIVEPERPQMTTRRMFIACWMPKTANTLSEYATLAAFPLQQRLYIASQLCIIRKFPLLLV
jgi:hypothetical protein